ncbi:pilus assembly protein [Calidifontibacter sp. DB0510]|uniref:Pilus assembly protein n=1 Tax=Metallococcus carri TaxID=1656884 RepID=A0A967B306_9MICO|nr:pilus assembly protein [Metallococcus carri]NHN56450.1 pilus assembly protein [Metallococcus carri]NOP36074.1 pilus assembly protein [Calidifontibacter sp. DB2511S]
MSRLRARLGRRDSGSAVLEFLVVGVLLTLPVFYLVMCLARLQAGAYGAAAASREAGRMFVTATDDGAAWSRASAGMQLALQDQGFGGGGLQVACTASPCLTRGASVTTTTSVRVDLPLIPDFLRGVVPSTVELRSRHTETVGRYRG